MKVKAIETHLVKHIYMAYASKMMAENPELYGKYHHKIKNYYIYRTDNGKPREVFSYDKFRAIVEMFFRKAKIAIIQGDAISINKCGYICAKRVERDFRRKAQRKINWGKTRQQPLVWNEEKQKHVYAKVIYFTDDDWCRIAWFKPRIKNERYYEFEPTNPSSGSDNTGFKTEFSNALIADPLLKYSYLFSTIKDYTHEEN